MDLALSNLALHHLIEENQIIINGFINKVQTTPTGFLKLKVHTKEGDKTLIATESAIFITKQSISAKQNPGGFSSFVKKYIFNQRIISLKQKEFDRIVLMEFPDVTLIFELFSKGNVILCNKNFKILRAMKKEKWKDRELKKDEIYKFPSSRGKNPLNISETEFLNNLKENKKTIFGAIIDILNVAPGILNFIFEENKWNKTIDASKITSENSNKILKEIKQIYSKKEEGVFILDNIIYSINIKTNKEFDSISDLLNEKVFLENTVVQRKEETKSKVRKQDYQSQIDQCIIEENEFLETGEKIYLEYQLLQKIINDITTLRKNNLLDKEIENKLKSVHPELKEIKLEKNKLLIEI